MGVEGFHLGALEGGQLRLVVLGEDAEDLGEDLHAVLDVGAEVAQQLKAAGLLREETEFHWLDRRCDARGAIVNIIRAGSDPRSPIRRIEIRLSVAIGHAGGVNGAEPGTPLGGRPLEAAYC
ncbi:hypothetical protein GCM10008096_29050 [Zhihengliuella salsuginis]|uniref:Uncharacterized protein n=1 Tax=Zhihengliuella salsuginis TaxID=578222 RepID=A0ABQ3GMA4_9MICC|nr:hypothetical protein GCM10008096_29050 [Zhihengliuella salsuginis]